MSPLRYPVTNKAKGHPLASASGTVLLHRKNLYDAIGPGKHPCHWCGATVEWTKGNTGPSALVVDHLDGDRRNAEPTNLVPSCNPCNVRRSHPQTIQAGELTFTFPTGIRTRAVRRECETCGQEFLAPITLTKAGQTTCSRSCSVKRQWRLYRLHRPSPSASLS